MRALQAVLEGLREVFAHKARSGIAMLALACGVASLFATFALTDGGAEAERQFLIKWGGVEKFYIIDKPLPPSQEKRRGVSPGKTLYDVEAIQKSVSLAKHVAPHTTVIPRQMLAYGKTRTWRFDIVASTPDVFQVDNYEIGKGRPLTDLDIERKTRVCVLGAESAKMLGLTDGVGKSVFIGRAKFRVVGIHTKDNAAVIIPVTTAQRMFYTAATATEPERNDNLMFQRIAVKLPSLDLMNAAIDQIRSVLSVTHHGLEDVGFNTMEDWNESIDGRVAATKLSGSLTAVVSLLVGGIGITNVMLASVRQRMREIGVRRAVGARSSDIFIQIVTETTVLALIGASLGLAAGVALLQLLSIGVEDVAKPIVTVSSWWMSFSSAIIVGILAGIYPAIRGSQVSPNEALRYE